MIKRIIRQLAYRAGLRPARWNPELLEGIRARWWYRLELANFQDGFKSVSPYRIVR